ncbi:MAG: M56 family metallopeptidase, partial [Mucilaginibacter sp.]
MSVAQYIILANLCIALLLGFYLVFLKKETFFQLNRAYLLGSLLISFFIPKIQTNWIGRLNVTQQIKYSIIAEPITIFANPAPKSDHFTFNQVILFLYLTGVAIYSINLIIRLISVKRMIRSFDGASSYSFFKKIHLGGKSLSPLIYEHESIHAAQWHSLDIILMEIVLVFNWFNPAMYYFRKELKKLHEFIADEGVLRSVGSKKEYAMLLLSQTFEVPINNLVNTFFNQNLLKQRIMMIQKNRSQKKALLKYGLSLPLFVLMIILSSATMINSSNSFFPDKNPLQSKAKSSQTDQGPIFTEVEHVPSYPGGVDKFYAFLQKNIKYPAKMREKNVQGKVYIGFIVEKDGTLSNLKILREPGYGSGKEALRVMSLSPKWEPG